jgi:hypothetical protein
VEKFLGMFSIIVSYWMWRRKLRELAGDGADFGLEQSAREADGLALWRVRPGRHEIVG